jgi:hypothetical protein
MDSATGGLTSAKGVIPLDTGYAPFSELGFLEWGSFKVRDEAGEEVDNAEKLRPGQESPAKLHRRDGAILSCVSRVAKELD